MRDGMVLAARQHMPRRVVAIALAMGLVTGCASSLTPKVGLVLGAATTLAGAVAVGSMPSRSTCDCDPPPIEAIPVIGAIVMIISAVALESAPSAPSSSAAPPPRSDTRPRAPAPAPPQQPPSGLGPVTAPAPPPPPPPPRGFFCASSAASPVAALCTRASADCRRARDAAITATPDLDECRSAEAAFCHVAGGSERCAPTLEACAERARFALGVTVACEERR
jgi:hypothetical protein